MPLDRRLQEGLRRNASVLDPAIDEALRSTERRGRRMVRVRRVAGAVIVAALLAASALVIPSLVRAGREPRVAGGPTVPAGTWRTPVTSASEAVAYAVGRGADRACASAFVGRARTLSFTFVIEGDRWIVYRTDDGGAPDGVGSGFVDITDGGTLRLFEPSVPSFYRFDQLTGPGTLDLHLAGVSLGASDLAGDGPCFIEAATLIQFTQPFTRMPDDPILSPFAAGKPFGVGVAPLTGTWTTDPLDAGALLERLSSAGDGACEDAALGAAPSRRYALTIAGDTWTLTETTGDVTTTLRRGWIEGYTPLTGSGLNVRMVPRDLPTSYGSSAHVEGDALRFGAVAVNAAPGEDPCLADARARLWFGQPFARAG